MRDATFVLDAILDNETDLPLMEHATDTAGFSEILFALFDLLGLFYNPSRHKTIVFLQSSDITYYYKRFSG